MYSPMNENNKPHLKCKHFKLKTLKKPNIESNYKNELSKKFEKRKKKEKKRKRSVCKNIINLHSLPFTLQLREA